jgi:hypothetical protein
MLINNPCGIEARAIAEIVTFKTMSRSAMFDSAKPSRINVSHFMTTLITNPEIWLNWKGQMPVICNKAEQGA